MNIIKTLLKLISIYILQVGALWSFLGAYTHFKGDSLKLFLEPFWLAIYIFPIITTGAYMFFQKKQIPLTPTASPIKVSTEADFSPGIVEKDYSVETKRTDEEKSAPEKESYENPHEPSNECRKEVSIATKGIYSPGYVGGSYSVKR